MTVPWPIVIAIIVGATVVVAIVGLTLVRRVPAFSVHFSENEVAGILFGSIGVLYGALLAFVVFAAWERFDTAQHFVVEEASAVVTSYRDTGMFPEPQRAQAAQELRTYVAHVTASAWVSQGTLTVDTAPDHMNAVWAIYRSVEPTTSFEEFELSSAMDRLHDLENARHLRHLSGEETLPWIFWPVLALGGVIMLLFSYFLYHGSLRAQAIMTGVTTAMLVGVLILIYSLNQPFTGPVSVSKDPLQNALVQFDRIDRER